jgi:polyisoprenoid-binding protein YceI
VSGKTIRITGDLTIKGVTRPVTLPAKMKVKDGILKANGKLIIDRTDWGIRYKSGKFYDIVADEIVSDDIEFHMNIVAKINSRI